jgi:hypothetical protein
MKRKIPVKNSRRKKMRVKINILLNGREETIAKNKKNCESAI